MPDHLEQHRRMAEPREPKALRVLTLTHDDYVKVLSGLALYGSLLESNERYPGAPGIDLLLALIAPLARGNRPRSADVARLFETLGKL